MPSINVKMVKVLANDLRKNDVFTTVLRGDGDLHVVVGIDKKGEAVQALPFNYLTSKPNTGIAGKSVAWDQTVRKVVGLKFVPAATASTEQ